MSALTAISVIKRIIEVKQEKGIIPTHAMRREVLEHFLYRVGEMQEELDMLVKNNEIVMVDTINDVAYELPEKLN